MQNERPIAFSSRSLTPVEQRYSPTKREALAVVLAGEHFNIYISGAPFHVITDHQPLLGILKTSKPTPLPGPVVLAPTNAFTLQYRPGKQNPAHYLSHHPVNITEQSSPAQLVADEHGNFTAHTSIPTVVTLLEAKETTLKDNTLRAVVALTESGEWHNANIYLGVNFDVLLRFKHVHDKLTVNEENSNPSQHSVGNPRSPRMSSHTTSARRPPMNLPYQSPNPKQGMLPGNDKVIEKAVSSCIPCQANTNRFKAEPLQMSPLPSGPWLHLSIDFCGALPTGEYLLVLPDEYSRYPIVEITRGTFADMVIPHLEKTIAIFGYPTVNGSPFQAETLKQFLETSGIKHRKKNHSSMAASQRSGRKS